MAVGAAGRSFSQSTRIAALCSAWLRTMEMGSGTALGRQRAFLNQHRSASCARPLLCQLTLERRCAFQLHVVGLRKRAYWRFPPDCGWSCRLRSGALCCGKWCCRREDLSPARRRLEGTTGHVRGLARRNVATAVQMITISLNTPATQAACESLLLRWQETLTSAYCGGEASWFPAE
jgi:hypothetical protein